jgi:hypothetical protein
MSQQQIDDATTKGYSLVIASPFEVGLLRNGEGMRTWYVFDFECQMPKLDHALVQEAIEASEKHFQK